MTPAPIHFHVNGQAVRVALDGSTALLHVLRNDLQLKGTRFGCGAGVCGSCTVLLDGRAVTSCDTPLAAAQGCAVTTVEGLGIPELPHPLQQAFLDLQAAQCAYCINGILMSLAALQAQAEPPNEAALQHTLSRHLCRCGAHLRILQAARWALGLAAAPVGLATRVTTGAEACLAAAVDLGFGAGAGADAGDGAGDGAGPATATSPGA